MENQTDDHLVELIDILLGLCEHIHDLAVATQLKNDQGAFQPISWNIDTVKDRLIDLKMRMGSG